MPKKRVELDGDKKYHVIIHSKGNKACPDLGRSIFVLHDANGEIVNGVALLQYHICCEAEEAHFQVQSHGSRKKSTNTPFYPTAKSTLQAIRDQLKEKPPSQALNAVPEDQLEQSQQGNCPDRGNKYMMFKLIQNEIWMPLKIWLCMLDTKTRK